MKYVNQEIINKIVENPLVNVSEDLYDYYHLVESMVNSGLSVDDACYKADEVYLVQGS